MAQPTKQEVLARLRSSLEAFESGLAFEGESDNENEYANECANKRENEDDCASECENEGSFGSVRLSAEDEKTPEKAYQQILRWVSVRERSTAYLRERLLKAEYSEQAVEEALERACRVHVVDDRRYADALIRMKLAAGKGLRDAEREIGELGIDPASLDSWQEHEALGRDAEVERALGVLHRRPPRAKQQREAAFRRLVSQGFSTDVASTAARRWAEGVESF